MTWTESITSSGARSQVVIVAALVLLVSGCSRSRHSADAASAQAAAVPVTIALVESRPSQTTLDVVGSLRGWEQVQVGAKKSGRVQASRRDVGDRVQPGEVLVELEKTLFDLMVQQGERRLAVELAKLGLTELPPADFDATQLPSVVQARVALERAEQRLVRQRELETRRMTSPEALENAGFDVAGARAALDQALLAARTNLAGVWAGKVELDVARQAREDSDVRAPEPVTQPQGLSEPLSYAVTRRAVSEGQMIREGEPVFELIIDNPLRLWVAVPERFTPYVAPGQGAKIEVSAFPQETFAGRVVRVNPAVDDRSRTFQVEIEVQNDARRLRPGGFAKASIVVEEKPKLMVPSESIVRFAGVTKLFVVRDAKAFAVPVEVGSESEGWSEVQGELVAQMTVVTAGQVQLADGTPVLVRRGEKLNDPPSPPSSDAAQATQDTSAPVAEAAAARTPES